MKAVWSAETAQYWRAYVPPNRPSRFELDLCSKVASKKRCLYPNRRLRLLILGSTVEYRDWAYEESMDVTIVDNSEEFHRVISADLRYKAAGERVVFKNWQDMEFDDEFDIVVGDLVVGNVPPDEIDLFLKNIKMSLVDGGCFITKSYFRGCAEDEKKTLDELFVEYEAHSKFEDPFPLLAYRLTMDSLDQESGILFFDKMYEKVRSAHDRGIISCETLKRYDQFGWHKGAKIKFFVLTLAEWERALSPIFSSVEKHFSPYKWGKEFPVFIVNK